MREILISACVYGDRVRWNGSHKKDDDIKVWALSNGFRLIPVCPEDELLGTPRQPIRMYYDTAIQANVGHLDVYEDLDEKCANIISRHPDAVGFIGIARSPSCGVSVGVKNLGKTIKAPMHIHADFPTTEISSMKSQKNRDMFLQRIEKYISLSSNN